MYSCASLCYRVWRRYQNVNEASEPMSRVSCQNSPTRHAYAWQIGPFWQDTLDMWRYFLWSPFILGIDHDIWRQTVVSSFCTTTTSDETRNTFIIHRPWCTIDFQYQPDSPVSIDLVCFGEYVAMQARLMTSQWQTNVNNARPTETRTSTSTCKLIRFTSLNTFLLPMYMFKMLSEVYILHLQNEIW